MENTKKIVKKELRNDDLSNDDRVKFIYDIRYYFSALTIKTPEGNFIVLLKDNGAELKKGIKKTSKETADILKRLVTSNNKSDEIMLGSANSNNLSNKFKRSYNYWYVIIPVVIVITLTGFYIKKIKLAINK